MRYSKSRFLVVSLLALLVTACRTYQDQKYDAPPSGLSGQNLMGVWVADYIGPGTGTDRLTIRADGKFKQEYESKNGYSSETPWNDWYLEKMSDGRAYLFLQGASFFDEGIKFAEQNGVLCTQPTCPRNVLVPFYDPISRTPVDVNGNLVLVVRSSATAGNDLVLKHLWTSFEDGISTSFFRIEQ